LSSTKQNKIVNFIANGNNAITKEQGWLISKKNQYTCTPHLKNKCQKEMIQKEKGKIYRYDERSSNTRVMIANEVKLRYNLKQ